MKLYRTAARATGAAGGVGLRYILLAQSFTYILRLLYHKTCLARMEAF